MAFKNSFLGRFFSPKQEKVVEKQAERTIQEKSAEPSAEKQNTVACLELSKEHALYRLYDLRISQAGDLPAPRLFMEGEQEMSQDEVERELRDFQKEMTVAAVLRLKNAVPEEGEEQEEAPDVDALPLVYIAKDRMSAWMMVFPPVGKGKELNQDILRKALKEREVTFGIDEKRLAELPGHQERYFCLLQIAKGAPAVNGTDGRIEDFFSRSIERKFAVDEHDRMDYMSLNLFQNIEKGAVICRMIPPTKGVAGKTVQGRVIPARDGKEVTLPQGQNTEISEDGNRLLASQTGDVEFRNRAFHVKSLLEISGNVDYSTGNIDYNGEVHICGNVSSGFYVRAKGNITVDGVVESGNVEAGGNLVVVKGIVGGGDAEIRVDHDLYAKYLENSMVHVHGNVYANSIVNSEVYCDGNIQVTSGRGVIIGGQLRAANTISAKAVGSRTESITTLFLGGQPCADYEMQMLEQDTEMLQKRLEKLERRPDSPSRSARMEELQTEWNEKQERLEKLQEEQTEQEEESEELKRCRLECDIAYPGILLNIGEVNFRLKHETWKCVAKLVDGEIRLV